MTWGQRDLSLCTKLQFKGEEEKGTYKGVATKNLELPRDRLLRGGEKTKGEGCWWVGGSQKGKTAQISERRPALPSLPHLVLRGKEWGGERSLTNILIVQAPRDAGIGASLGNCGVAKDFREPAQFVTNTFIHSPSIIQPPLCARHSSRCQYWALEKTLENKTWRNFLVDRRKGE